MVGLIPALPFRRARCAVCYEDVLTGVCSYIIDFERAEFGEDDIEVSTPEDWGL